MEVVVGEYERVTGGGCPASPCKGYPLALAAATLGNDNRIILIGVPSNDCSQREGLAEHSSIGLNAKNDFQIIYRFLRSAVHIEASYRHSNLRIHIKTI